MLTAAASGTQPGRSSRACDAFARGPCLQVTEADSVHPLTSFAARGRKYYVDAQNFPNKELLVRAACAAVLVPWERGAEHAE